MDEKIVHDKIGQEIRVSSIVAAPHSKTIMHVYRVSAITPKQLKLEDVSSVLGKVNWKNAVYKHHNEVICLDAMEETVMFLMTQNL